MRDFCLTLVEFLEEKGTAVAKSLRQVVENVSSQRSLSMIVSDLIDWSSDLKGSELEILDQKLRQRGCPALSVMRSKENRRFLEILARGKVRSEAELQLVTARLADVGPMGPSQREREKGNELLRAYERSPPVERSRPTRR
jgi:hypothetical protein